MVSTSDLSTLVTTAHWQSLAAERSSNFLHSGLNIHSWSLLDTDARLEEPVACYL